MNESKITIHPSGQSVECQTGDTVLMALERAGYALPNNCRAGACGECKVKILKGDIDQGIVLDMALSEDERKEGYGLMCMAKPISEELVIEWGTENARPKLFPPRENVTFIVTENKLIAKSVMELRIRPVGQPIRYWPGQYIKIGNADKKIPARAYSISNPFRPDGEITLQVAKIDDGITSKWIHEELKAGDILKVSGAYGTFIGDPSVDTPVLCMASGTGLAPVLALAEAALSRGFRKSVMVMVSNRTSDNIYAEGMMTWWKTKHRNFDYRFTLTREDVTSGDNVKGYLNGRINICLPKIFSDLSGHTIFIAGNPDFVDAAKNSALALGAKPDYIHTEGYMATQSE